jgi:hypothetical protein
MMSSLKILSAKQQIVDIHKAEELRHMAKFKSGSERDALIHKAKMLEESVRLVREYIKTLSN